MKKFWGVVFNVINESGIILEVIDSRMPEKTRNKYLEKYTLKRHKKLIIVINKCDLVKKEDLEKIKRKFNLPCVFISAKQHLGTLILKGKIMQFAKKFPVRVGIIGYPNTGKSSVINALKGRHAARTSPIAGFTKGKQWVKVTDKILLIDTPGIIPHSKLSETELVLASARSLESIKDPEGVAVAILKLVNKTNPDILKIRYNLKVEKIFHKSLEIIAKEKKKLKKGAMPDTELAAKMIIQDWQKGRLKK